MYTYRKKNPKKGQIKHTSFCNFSGNIPGNDVAKGETIVEYLQPVPPKGTGYHRHVFLLLQQNSQMDYSTILEQMSAKNGVGLDCRKFSTLEFYRERQDQLTPASYSFFQCNWDESVQNIYHKVFGKFAKPENGQKSFKKIPKNFKVKMNRFTSTIFRKVT